MSLSVLLSLLALGGALAAIGYTWTLNRELDVVRERLDRYHRALFKAEEALRTTRQRLAELEKASPSLPPPNIELEL
ncbi:MAG: hypothetical protein ACOYL7_07545 [Caldilinea sp.]|jgi:hypothetical protein